ncbi:MAG: kynurenine 3-monooxygenase [Bdellovibrio sp. CG12_big_fil_rev_8_21_14_0_65_39_13]|nr:MAG: kynurenine 3-monooxygenase [Bdellovibrio sp. CG22_combo_CG10-13_8_21_14_all_39_27]PIQ61699.1 MAG: kynurenine 3-monooxygenase [Bdellovibrio sp. CG12_big_fil_rev_8_21_14_0_65_39_13]PIR35642.1 MAG: kynurenine 3-monooxygenase [Bdellovibrio sp. CG11_big_fil_rev_8_21_14_0_20_39_38]PJB54453.1 MAG: hypothetical protein CO099_01490 [Bdellovibrio sp. CG_4_9_14_3_um_filter_39_7]
MAEKLIISGGGLVGSLAAIVFKKRGYDVEIFEKRSDLRLNYEGGRSINLIITSRGLNALKMAGVVEQVLPITVKVTGRMMHAKSGEIKFQPYGKDDNECNYSVSRSELNGLLLDLAQKLQIPIHFEQEVQKVSFDEKTCTVRDLKTQKETNYKFDRLVGTDGAGSPTRKCVIQHVGETASDRVDFLESDYKEMFMPAGENKQYPLDPKGLHIWPRGTHMLMALPNLGGSFTMTLYMPKTGGQWSFENINSPEKVKDLFQSEFPDAIPLMPKYIDDYMNNPQGVLGTVRCHPWHVGDSVFLAGDAAHAIVPFFGQGMNCGFEDISTLVEILDQCGNNWGEALQIYSQNQKKNADAIADMAIENFVEMKDKVGDAQFLFRKMVDGLLEKEFSDIYRTRYAMVTYTLVPYSITQQAGLIQNKILDQLCDGKSELSQIDLKEARNLLEKDFMPFLNKNKVKLETFTL